MKQEVRSKTEKSESDAPVTKYERKEVESPKNYSQEEMKSDTIKRKNTTAEDGDKFLTHLQISQSSFLKIILLYHFQVPPLAVTKNRTLE